MRQAKGRLRLYSEEHKKDYTSLLVLFLEGRVLYKNAAITMTPRVSYVHEVPYMKALKVVKSLEVDKGVAV